MLNCSKYENLLMRYFDHDLKEREQKKLNEHLDSCPDCRLLFSQLSGILNTLENAKPAEPEPDLQRLVMDRVMALPPQAENNQYRLIGVAYGLLAGVVALILLISGITIQESGFSDIILAARQYLDMISIFVMDMQIAYQIVAGMFPSEIYSLFLSIQFIFIASILMIALVAVRRTYSRQAGGHPDVS